jgi:hypothetical protein
MIKCALNQVLRSANYLLSLEDYFIFYKNGDITFLTAFILTHPVNFSCGRKPEHPEKTHDFPQSQWKALVLTTTPSKSPYRKFIYLLH